MLYAEGATAPKMMSIGLHCRIIGRPGRALGLAKFLDYVKSHEKVSDASPFTLSHVSISPSLIYVRILDRCGCAAGTRSVATGMPTTSLLLLSSEGEETSQTTS